MTAFYLASRFSRRYEMRGYRTRLETIGHSVTAQWIDTNEDDGNECECAVRDVRDVEIADGLMLFAEQPRCPTRGGRFVEMGIARGLGKTVIVIGGVENVFCALPEIARFENFDAAFSELRSWLGNLPDMRKATDYRPMLGA